MKGKLYLTIILGVLIVTTSIYGLNQYSIRNNDDAKVFFSEEYLGEQKLIEKSDIIVSGQITKLIEKKADTIKPTKENTVGVKAHYCTYNLEVLDNITGNSPKNLNLVFVGSSIPDDLTLNKEYVFFLEKDMLSGNNYHLTSYTEGVLNIDEQQLSNTKTDYKIQKDILIKKIKEVKNKN